MVAKQELRQRILVAAIQFQYWQLGRMATYEEVQEIWRKADEFMEWFYGSESVATSQSKRVVAAVQRQEQAG